MNRVLAPESGRARCPQRAAADWGQSALPGKGFAVACLLTLAAALPAAGGVWTNALGRAFSARLVAVDDREATFVFDEDGATNRVALAKLDEATRLRACREAGYMPVPPRLASTFKRATQDMRQTRAMEADGRLDAEKASARRAAIRAAFASRCRAVGLADEDAALILKRIEK